MKKIKILVVIRGGLVDEVRTNSVLALENAELVVMDDDAEEFTEEQQSKVLDRFPHKIEENERLTAEGIDNNEWP
jgi:hypothetical protein